MSQDLQKPLIYCSRSHRMATRIADKTANPQFSDIAHQAWLSAYRNAYDVLSREGKPLGWRAAAVISVVALALGWLLRGGL